MVWLKVPLKTCPIVVGVKNNIKKNSVSLMKTPVVSEEELQAALEELRSKDKDNAALPLLELIVDRLQETADVFNEHEHPVHDVVMEKDLYHSAGDGHTSSPAKKGGFGCHLAYQIGFEREKKR